MALRTVTIEKIKALLLEDFQRSRPGMEQKVLTLTEMENLVSSFLTDIGNPIIEEITKSESLRVSTQKKTAHIVMQN